MTDDSIVQMIAKIVSREDERLAKENQQLRDENARLQARIEAAAVIESSRIDLQRYVLVAAARGWNECRAEFRAALGL